MTDPSSIVIGRGVLDDIVGGEVPSTVVVLFQSAVAETARRVAGAYASAGASVVEIEAPDGELAKTPQFVTQMWERLAPLGLTRADVIVGVGGGALTDAAGFVAATFLRGIPAIYVPTTLLGAVDAAIGGKTGINIAGKNLVGSFRHPDRVVIDVEILERLPAPLLSQGAAEALKAGLIGDRDLFEMLERDGLAADVEPVVRMSVGVKLAVVTEDFTERGRRVILNYGHTVGHAVEVAAGLSHGEAVAIGMVAAGKASEIELGFPHAERQTAALVALGLPVAAPPVGRGRVWDLVRLDKKRTSDAVSMVLLADIGEPVVREVSDATVDAALDAIGLET